MTDKQDLIVRQMIDRDSYTYSYLIFDPETRLAALIDPVLEQYERDFQLIEELGLELLYTLETHVHADHITSAGKIHLSTGAAIGCGAAAGVRGVDHLLGHGDTLPLGTHAIRVLSTPGHTNGCLSYVIGDAVFTGDCLLIRGCGRTDFQQGSSTRLYHSITEILYSLPDHTRVFPAHDYRGQTMSTIGEEKSWNPRVRIGTTSARFTEIMSNLNLALPKKINEAVPANTQVGVENRKPRLEFSMSDLHQQWQQLSKGQLIIDNRSEEEYAEGHVPGSHNIPFGTEINAVDYLRQFDHIYIYCRSGRRAQTATTTLAIHGIDNVDCVSHGGMPEWIEASYPVET